MALAWSKAWLVSEGEGGNTVLQIQQCQTLGITRAFRIVRVCCYSCVAFVVN